MTIMSVMERKTIDRNEFISLVYPQVGEVFASFLCRHENDGQNRSLVNLDEQNAACRFLGIDVSARNMQTSAFQSESDRENRITEIRKELTEKIIGILYDVLTENLSEVPEGRNADVNLLPDKLRRFYTLEDTNTCPLCSEAILSRMCYLLDKYPNAQAYSEDTNTLFAHLKDLELLPVYVNRAGTLITDISDKIHLPDGDWGMIEALNQGLLYEEDIYRFADPDIAQIVSRVYEYRNGSVHKADWMAKSLVNKFQSVSDMILIGMIVITKNIWPIYLKMMRRKDNELIGAEEYCSNIVRQYESTIESRLCQRFMWKLSDNAPLFAQELDITKRGNIADIALSLLKANQGKVNILQGIAGCGKTWAMRKLCYTFACYYSDLDPENNIGFKRRNKKGFSPIIPVFIAMKSWYNQISPTPDSIVRIVAQIIIQNNGFTSDRLDCVREGVRTLLDSGRLLIVFDGIDECPYSEKPRIYRAIDAFSDRFSATRPTSLIFISDREITAENQSMMISYTADKLVSNEIREYVRTFMKAYPKDGYIDEEGQISPRKQSEFETRLSSLKDTDDIKTAYELAQLAMICSMDEQYNIFLNMSAEKRSQALDYRYLVALMEREAKEKLITETGSWEEHFNNLRDILRSLACRFEDEGINKIEMETFITEIKEKCRNERLAQTYRKHLVQSGILAESQDMVDFRWYISFSNEKMFDAAALL